MSKPTIAVTGATGAQGGSVVRALLADDKFRVRGITRNVDSEKAVALAKLGVEVVAAELDDAASLLSAFKGAYGVYGVTASWAHIDPAKELQQLKNIADAAKAAGVKHVVASVLEDTRKYVKEGTMPKLMDGKYYVPHFDGKGESIDYLLATCPCTPLITSFYYENFTTKLTPKALPDGTLALTAPLGDKPLCMQAVDDIGRFAAYLFANNTYIGKVVGIGGDTLTFSEVASLLTKALGKEVVYNSVEPAAFAAMGFPGAADLTNMLQYFRDCAEVAAALRVDGRKAPFKFKPFETWLDEHKDDFA